MNTNEWRKIFEDTVDQNNFEEFNKRYVEYLKKFDAFDQSYSATPAEVAVTNAIFGKHSFFLKQTTDAQGVELLAKGRASGRVFENLSVEERLEFLKVLKSKIDKYQDDIVLTITADTGKPIDLSRGEMAKGGEWFKYAQDEAVNQLGEKSTGKSTRSTRGKGVSQVIGAYNYPYALAISGIVSSLAAGNGIIISAPLKAPN
jgi:succinate-semialdehyde dehydrogenase/glutarate-semialdehyde dehydrogenase